VHGTHGGLVLRPDVRKGLGLLATGALIGGGTTVSAAIGAGPGWALLAAVSFGAVVVFGAVNTYVTRIILTPQEVIERGAVYRRRRARSRVAEVVRARIAAPNASPADTVFLLDARRSRLLRLTVGHYPRGEVDRLVGALGVPCGGPSEPVSADELAKMYPGLDLVSAFERHPYRFASAITGAVVAAVLVGVLAAVRLGAF